MPLSRPERRRIQQRKKSDRQVDGMVAGVQRLMSLGNYDRNELSLEDIDKIRDLIDRLGAPTAAEKTGCSEQVLYKTCAGFAHRLLPTTAAQIRKFLGKK